MYVRRDADDHKSGLTRAAWGTAALVRRGQQRTNDCLRLPAGVVAVTSRSSGPPPFMGVRRCCWCPIRRPPIGACFLIKRLLARPFYQFRRKVHVGPSGADGHGHGYGLVPSLARL